MKCAFLLKFILPSSIFRTHIDGNSPHHFQSKPPIPNFSTLRRKDLTSCHFKIAKIRFESFQILVNFDDTCIMPDTNCSPYYSLKYNCHFGVDKRPDIHTQQNVPACTEILESDTLRWNATSHDTNSRIWEISSKSIAPDKQSVYQIGLAKSMAFAHVAIRTKC